MDYKKLGFKCGLEIHRQMDTQKLFCNCPSLVNDTNKPDIIVKRRLRTVASELGEVDKAAEYEKIKDKEFIYEGCSSSSCLIELDEQPPKEINKEALQTALMVCLMLNAKFVDEIQIMRKIVIDGSNPTGFQRTMLMGYGGVIKTSKGDVRIDTICLEEEAAKKIKEDEKSVIYRLDRLGVPLIEIATDASIKDNEHAKEVAELIGMVLKSTGKFKSGLGSIRQDINISINNGARVEVKGFQELRQIPKAVEAEVERQLKEKTEPHVRYINKDLSSKYLRPMPGAQRMYPETDIEPIDVTKDMLKIKLPELLTNKINEISREYGITNYLAEEILNNGFEKYFNNKLEPKLIANILIEVPKEIKSRFNIDVKEENIKKILEYLEKNLISKDAVIDALVNLEKNKFDLNNYKKADVRDIEKEIKKIKEGNKDLSANALMGIIMKKYKGKIDGKKVFEILNSK